MDGESVWAGYDKKSEGDLFFVWMVSKHVCGGGVYKCDRARRIGIDE